MASSSSRDMIPLNRADDTRTRERVIPPLPRIATTSSPYGRTVKFHPVSETLIFPPSSVSTVKFWGRLDGSNQTNEKFFRGIAFASELTVWSSVQQSWIDAAWPTLTSWHAGEWRGAGLPEIMGAVQLITLALWNTPQNAGSATLWLETDRKGVVDYANPDFESGRISSLCLQPAIQLLRWTMRAAEAAGLVVTVNHISRNQNKRADADASAVRDAQKVLQLPLDGYWRGDWLFAVQEVRRYQIATSHLSKNRLEAPLPPRSPWRTTLRGMLLWFSETGAEEPPTASADFVRCPLCKTAVGHPREACHLPSQMSLRTDPPLSAKENSVAQRSFTWNEWPAHLRSRSWVGACDQWGPGDVTEDYFDWQELAIQLDSQLALDPPLLRTIREPPDY
jgi:hypothetical protein